MLDAEDLHETDYDAGNRLRALGLAADAAAAYRRALARSPQHVGAAMALGQVLLDAGDGAEAAGLFGHVVAVEPSHADAACYLGMALHRSGKLDDARRAYERALALRPLFPEAANNLAHTLQCMGRARDAEVWYRHAVSLAPRMGVAWNGLGIALYTEGRYADAAGAFRQVLALLPRFAPAHNNLGLALMLQGEVDAARECFAQAAAILPDYADAQSNLLLVESYLPTVSMESLATAHAEWARRVAPTSAPPDRFTNSRDIERPLRIAIVSGDLKAHAVAHFLLPAMEHLGRGGSYVACYSTSAERDVFTERFNARADRWRDVTGTADADLASQIRSDGIDLLLDVAGHTAGGRAGVLARRAAPVQVSWLGYPATTGIAQMDYFIGDRHTIPPSAEPFYTEQVLRMADCYACFEPPPFYPAVCERLASGAGSATFCSFSNPAKVNRPVVETWAGILRRVPGSTLLLKYRGFADPSTQARFARSFHEQGVDPARVIFDGWSSFAEMYTRYAQCDISLDPFPFGGGAMTCISLWMGVPVVTCPGETFASRQSLSYLSTIGLTETIAKDLDEYVEIAVRLANDTDRLAELRCTLRDRMAGSPLCDGPRFARNFMTAIRAIWRNWCANADENGFLPPEKRPVEIDWGAPS